ncbi:MAG: CpaF family protein [Planctomycetes bacterium]|nr:CpaF family protein [Planctomycetota bacterium]
MRVIVQNIVDNTSSLAFEARSDFIIGSGPAAHVRLPSARFVWPDHVSVQRRNNGWVASVRPGADKVVLDGQSIGHGVTRRLRDISTLSLAQFTITLDSSTAVDSSREDESVEMHRLQHDLHALTLQRINLHVFEVREGGPSPDQLDEVNKAIDDVLHNELRARVISDDAMRSRLLVQAFKTRFEIKDRAQRDDAAAPAPRVRTPGRNHNMEMQAVRCLEQVLREVPGIVPDEPMSAEAEAAFDRTVRVCAAKMSQPLVEYIIGQLLKKLTCDLLFGLGPLQDLMDAPGINEIMVVEPSLVYVERVRTLPDKKTYSEVVRSNKTFVNNDLLLSVIERIVAPLGRRIDLSQPTVDARLPKARVHAIIPPLALRGPCLTIRRFGKQAGNIDELVANKLLNRGAAAFLSAAVRGRKNIIVAGGTGAGKTTLLNALGRLIPAGERIVTIEDAAELRLDHEHVVSLEARPQNSEGRGEVTIRELVKNALRMRPDRVIVGECRGGEAIDMLQAMNTGHAGCLTTIHANSAEDVMSRLETLICSAIDLPLPAVRRQVSQAINLVVYIQRLGVGRRITQIAEVMGINPGTGEVEVEQIFSAGRDGRLRATGYMPSFLPSFVASGLLTDSEWLSSEAA